MVRVLVVHANVDAREALQMALTDFGYSVAVAATAQAGVEVLLASPEPLVVLFDYFMPALTGQDLVLLVERDVPFAARHAFICLTTDPRRMPERLTAWLAERRAPVLAEPFDLDSLHAVVAREAARLPVQP